MSWWEQEPPSDDGYSLATTQRELSLLAEQSLVQRKQSQSGCVLQSQLRISSSHEQSPVNSALPIIWHQPPSLQKGLTGEEMLLLLNDPVRTQVPAPSQCHWLGDTAKCH